MIWLDSSFAIEALLGTTRASDVEVPSTHLVTLPAQVAEIAAFFLKRSSDFDFAVLASVELISPVATEAVEAARLYLAAREARSKASLSDAMLASVALARGGDLLAFDEDFRHLGFRRVRSGLWTRT